MPELPFTGERYVPGLDWPDISYEHWHRYLYAAEFAARKTVLDVACGEGYGSDLLAETADRVIGIDIDPQIVEFAAKKYQRANLEFRCGPAHALPVSEGNAFDLVVSFETLEHMAEEHQRRFLGEAKRLLKPDGVLLISTPNKLLYTDQPAYSNPFHVKELYRAEFLELLQRYFRAVKVCGQMVYPVSYIWPAAGVAAATSEHQLVFSRGCFTPVKGDEKQMRYMLAVCSDVEASATRGSLLIDLSNRLTGQLHEHIAALDRSVERLKVSLDEQQAAADLRVREGEGLVARIAALELEAARAASQTSNLTQDVAVRDEMVRGLQGQAASRDQLLLDARAEATALNKRVKALESELVARKADVAQLRGAIGTKDLAMARAREDIAARDQALGQLQLQVEELRRDHDELLAAKHRSESEAARLNAVMEERAALIQRLEAASARREDAIRELEREMAVRAAWGYRTLEALIAAHITGSSEGARALSGSPPQDPPPGGRQGATVPAHQVADSASPGREPASMQEPSSSAGTHVPEPATIGEIDSNLALIERALEAERSERHRLEGAVKQAYAQLKRRIAEAVDRHVPRKSTVVVVSKGDEDLLRLNGRPAWHFPQTEAGVYAGHYPADSSAAIDHIETLRAKGAQFLVFPSTSAWWLDHYSEFADHLIRHYRRIFERDDVGVVFDLRRARPLPRDWRRDFSSAVEQFAASFRRDPAILDCRSGLHLAHIFPRYAVFSPPEDGPVLPYLDSTIDVTVCRAGSPLAKDARRVTSTLLLTAAAGPNGSRSAGVRLQAEWLVQKRAGRSPDVSIIIPCHNGVGLTQSCLDAVAATLPPSRHIELIVVDDASTDGTRAMLKRWAQAGRKLRVLRNSRNLGFLRSCNRAARAARGEIIVLLNNDTRPAPGWLTALLRTFEDHLDAGAVGGKLVFPDGTLQEAGSLVFRDGSAANFGRGDRNPDHPLFNYVRQVDYCSAALLATPRRLFLELEGFDRRYVPAYYEDTDYCFKLRDKGYSVYYQPAAKVIHHEGASCGTDPERGVKRHQFVNRGRFFERWKTALERQPERPQHEDFDSWQRLAVRSA
jgi:GT2 family glycosyltransferase/SAM-dependent methyltransferase